jgi:hypothetical protein
VNEPSRPPGPRSLVLDERRLEALTLAMAIAPGVYVRNRMFELFTHPSVVRARTRASVLRGVVRQLGLASDVTVETEVRSSETSYVLRYRIASMRMSRVVDLTRAELSAIRVLGAKAGLSCLPPDEEDRHRVDGALAHLLDLGSLGGLGQRV